MLRKKYIGLLSICLLGATQVIVSGRGMGFPSVDLRSIALAASLERAEQKLQQERQRRESICTKIGAALSHLSEGLTDFFNKIEVPK